MNLKSPLYLLWLNKLHAWLLILLFVPYYLLLDIGIKIVQGLLRLIMLRVIW
jgi:hypothetical protein